MFLEKRKVGKSIKHYLVYSYRGEDNEVIKIRRFLGTNLSEKELEKLRKRAEEIINQRIEDMRTNVFDFSLSDKEIQALNRLNDKIKIIHFDDREWQQFTEEFVYNTNAIEGSNVLEKEVPLILKKKKAINNDEIETKGLANAVEYIRKTKENLSLKLMLKLHKLCFTGSKSSAGEFRDVEVGIFDSSGRIIHQGTLVKDLDKELTGFIDWYKKNKNKFKPLVLAAIIHNQFENIHPFQDGNGRVGRLLLNFILLKNNYPPINILLEDRGEYYYTLQEYEHNDKLRPTLEFLIKQYKKTLRALGDHKK
ncbi:MAG: Fic family protein [Nanoarchaeota archaeon]|nr:Fic family protein [Nanoarchaeota archaeon]MBU1031078.1 Fic family protein [Nanoarchaeota archaeon]MBU1850501.1 Fic family protein [Nanoarchaeota archaeon]